MEAAMTTREQSDRPAKYRHLFTPLDIGRHTLRNRIVMAPHGVSFLAGHGNAVDRIIDYHVERARGGAAMITMSNFVMPPSWRRLGTWGGNLETSAFGGLDLANEPALANAYGRLAGGIHDEGALFVVQLNAGGRQYYTTGMVPFGIPLAAPSALPCPRTRTIPKAMAAWEIEEMVETFAKAARMVRDAGADGVELFAAQGYLLSEFLSPHTNRRDDAYGGSLENRMRFMVEALAAIRHETGPDFLVGLRMNGDDFVEGGFGIEEACKVAGQLADQQMVDYINVSGMTYLDYPGWIADATQPEATFAPQAAAIRAAGRGLPIAVVTRIGRPGKAEEIIASGAADMVGMARALISDPEFPKKAMAGDEDDIRYCTYSNQSCSMGQSLGRGVGCIHNTAVGKEGQLGIGRMRPAAQRKRVLVVGGGPGGMAAARVAAERGHSVRLLERNTELGGQLRYIARMKARREFAEVTRWLTHRLNRLGVTIETGIAADRAVIAAASADALVMATGSFPGRSGQSAFRADMQNLPGMDPLSIFTVFDVFERPQQIGRRVVIVDEDPHLSAAYVAEHLADNGHAVTIVTPQLYPARELHPAFVPALYRALRSKGVEIVADTQTMEVAGGTLVCRTHFTGQDRRIVFDGLILAMGNVADNDLAHEARGIAGEIFEVGDCVAPRRIDDAILDGERAGWMI